MSKKEIKCQNEFPTKGSTEKKNIKKHVDVGGSVEEIQP